MIIMLCNPSLDVRLQLLERTMLWHSIVLPEPAQNEGEFCRQRVCLSKGNERICGERLQHHSRDARLHPWLPFCFLSSFHASLLLASLRRGAIGSGPGKRHFLRVVDVASEFCLGFAVRMIGCECRGHGKFRLRVADEIATYLGRLF